MRGFSLIESIICISLLLLAVLLIMNLVPASWVAVNQAEQRLFAGNLAQSLLEEQRGIAFENLAPATLPPVTRTGATFNPQIEVIPVPGYDRLKTVRVRVTWDSRAVHHEELREVVLCRAPR